MKSLNIKAFLALSLALTVGIWICLLALSGLTLEVSWPAFKVLPTVLSIEMMIWALFVKWGWRFRILSGWLVPFPNLQGTWKGTITTNWIDPKTNHRPAPIELVLVIRQSFLHLNCTLLTLESESRSFSASIHVDQESNERRLIYTYRNNPRPSVRDRSPIHSGTASLLVISDPPQELRGEYWTSRESTGEISLRFSSKALLEKFDVRK
jgi:hypothetical protein